MKLQTSAQKIENTDYDIDEEECYAQEVKTD